MAGLGLAGEAVRLKKYQKNLSLCLSLFIWNKDSNITMSLFASIPPPFCLHPSLSSWLDFIFLFCIYTVSYSAECWYTYKQQNSPEILWFSTEQMLLGGREIFSVQQSFTVSSLLIVTLELLTFSPYLQCWKCLIFKYEWLFLSTTAPFSNFFF